MQKIYLLLRSNKQTGPYTFEELLQLNLKPFDLVWVEGRSAAWQYPFEIAALKPYVPETPQAAIPFQPVATAAMESRTSNNRYAPPPAAPAKETRPAGRVFVSIPKTYQQPYYSSAESTPASATQAGFEQAVEKPPVSQTEPLLTNYSKPLEELEEDYSNWMYRQKTRKKATVATRDLVIAGLILALIGGGYFVVSRPAVTNKILPNSHPEARTLRTVPPQPPVEPDGAGSKEPSMPVAESRQILANQPPPQPKRIQPKNQAPVANSQTAPPAHVQNTIPGENPISKIPPEQQATSETNSVETRRDQSATPKKKKLGEMIRGIFAKKEQQADESVEEATAGEPRPANNRQATKRDAPDAAESRAPTTEIEANQIDLYSNHSENWMMGVRDLNITLRNRSKVGIQTALVSVKYFDENNRLLDKKTIRFENVPANGKRTVAAPENKWADHADFELASVTAKDDRYASHQ